MSFRQSISLSEGGDNPPVNAAVAMTLTNLDIATCSYLGNGFFNVQSVKKIGVVSQGLLQIRIHPKTPISNLIYILGFSDRGVNLDPSTVTSNSIDVLLDFMVDLFVHEVNKLVARGLIRRYRDDEVMEPAIRGRIDFQRLISTRFGMRIPLPLNVQEFDVNCWENQILLAALIKMQKVLNISGKRKLLLRNAVRRFEGVDLVDFSSVRDTPPFDRLSRHYEVASKLALSILRSASIENTEGITQSSGFLIDMWKVFEDFLLNDFKINAIGQTRLISQGQQSFLDIGKQVQLKPDYRWQDSRCTLAVADAKYKLPSFSGPSNSDIYQMLAYCTRFGTREGFLLYAETYYANFQIENADVLIKVRGIDLSGSIDGLKAELAKIRSEISAGIPMTVTP
jgi:5-methylcytosine-specific restriction enzyme subunit McrC